ncbi:hypothetical protein EDB86DRAFT_221816 [Lactarius hatsudake]|nr:hypothetical protein EDB86DRAFT_221816 [Lactarius hatsudake]
MTVLITHPLRHSFGTPLNSSHSPGFGWPIMVQSDGTPVGGAAGSGKTVESFRVRKEKWLNSFSKGMMSRLESSATFPSMHIYKTMLVHTLNWLREDRDLQKFVAGIPGLCESEALTTYDYMGDRQHSIRNVLAALPGPTSFHPSLPWSIIQLAQRAISSKLPESKPRTLACLRALYYIPGAIRDLLAPYAAEKNHSSNIRPLLDSPESLEIIYKLQKTSSDDVAIPVRCVAAVVAAYMTTHSPPTTPSESLIGDNKSGGKQFLNERLHVGGDGGVAHEYHSDSARLQNIVCFLTDIREMLGDLNKQWWASKNWNLIRKECAELFRTRRSHTEEYRTASRRSHRHHRMN